jgi:signal transduction histidine kinase/ABC-type multidrug transport system ATPase subunit
MGPVAGPGQATRAGRPSRRDRGAPLLAVRDVYVRYGEIVALDGVDLEIRPGELVALAGENGAGKTSLVRCIVGDLRPSRGEVELFGRPAGRPGGRGGRVAVVWQDLALCDNLDVASNLLLGGERRFVLPAEWRFHQQASRVLADLRIDLPDTGRSVRSLSGGQRQLLAVARAMRNRPDVLILDEPTSALGVAESAEVEELVLRLRAGGATVVLVTHDIDQIFRIADRIVVLRAGRLVADLDVSTSHRDELVAIMSGQEIDSSARGQLTRLQRLADRLSTSDRSSSLPLILSTLGAALGAERLAIHRRDGALLRCVASFGLPPALRSAWGVLPMGPAGGPVGLAASRERTVIDDDISTGAAWSAFREVGKQAGVASSWAVPVSGSGGLLGVITVVRSSIGRPDRDELDLVTLYAGYVAGAIERDRLFGEVTARNRLLETIRELLETLAGPVRLADGIAVALCALCGGLDADEVALVVAAKDGPTTWRGIAGPDGALSSASPELARAVDGALAGPIGPHSSTEGEERLRVVTFMAPSGAGALAAAWSGHSPGSEAEDLLADAAHSLQLALEREEAGLVQQEAAALRRSQDLQRGFLSRLSHELRTPLTAIRGYASSLLQTDVTWDSASTSRFLSRVVGESARLGRLVDDLLDFNAIESGVMRLQRDWCNLPLVLEAAAACLPPEHAARTTLRCAPGLPVIWADHDRLEQVFVNLMENAFRHNPPGTSVEVTARAAGESDVVLTVRDDGAGLPPELVEAPFDPERRSRVATAGTGLGLSIARAVVEAHGGSIELELLAAGTGFRITLPVEDPRSDEAGDA